MKIDALHIEDMVEKKKDEQLNGPITWGMIMDAAQSSEWLQSKRDHSFTVKTTVGELLDLFGEENVKTLVQEKTAAASRNPAYERTTKNIVGNWIMLGLFILLYALLSVISLELIDKDKR